MTTPVLRIKRIGSHTLPLPAYAHEGDAGLDLRAAADCTIPPHGRCIVECGFAFEIPPGFEGQVRPRSGWSTVGIVTVLGTIDCTYRGEIKMIIENHSFLEAEIKAGDKMAQLVIAPVVTVMVEEVAELSATDRGADGFGSTGR